MTYFIRRIVKKILSLFHLYYMEPARAEVASRLNPEVGRIAAGLTLSQVKIAEQISPRMTEVLTKLDKRTVNIAASLTPQSFLSLTQSGVYRPPAKRSVVFLGNSYYHFYYLAQALRRRGWDAIVVSMEDPNSSNYLYYHGEDLNLFDSNPELMRYKLEGFFEAAKERYQMMHFAGDGCMSFFPDYYRDEDSKDIVEWKALGHKIAYTVSGCLSATSQSSVANWSRQSGDSVCDHCVWRDKPNVCSDEKNLAWGKKVQKHCDLIFGETLPALDFIASPRAIREPVSMCLDPVMWHPDLVVPEKHKVERGIDEILIYHAVGNYDSRTKEEKNIKGTHVIIEAIDRLKAEGFPVRLIFATNIMNREVRYLQAQADIIVDQLNMGRYGANARESLMLGKPIICYINKHEDKPEYELNSLNECPLVSASEQTVYAALKDLCMNKDKRLKLGQAGRKYALKWHSADACAERYEKIYDDLMAGNLIEHPQSWHYYEVECCDNLEVVGKHPVMVEV